MAVASFTAATLCLLSYRRDCRRLQALGRMVTAGAETPQEQVLQLLHWVYRNKGFTWNPRYFVFPGLRATPVQVLENGGDCADKSRLLSAMLRALGIPATMAMCFDRQSLKPSHTVVEARVGPEEFMVVDPVYDLSFFKPGGSRYAGLLDLRSDPGILEVRLDDLRQSGAGQHPSRFYHRHRASYDLASTVNWNKNFMTRAVRAVLYPWLGERVYRLPRPVFGEEPKLVAVACGLLPVAAILFALTGRACARRFAFGRTSTEDRRSRP